MSWTASLASDWRYARVSSIRPATQTSMPFGADRRPKWRFRSEKHHPRDAACAARRTRSSGRPMSRIRTGRVAPPASHRSQDRKVSRQADSEVASRRVKRVPREGRFEELGGYDAGQFPALSDLVCDLQHDRVPHARRLAGAARSTRCRCSPGAAWTITFGDALIALTLVFLFFEVLKATQARARVRSSTISCRRSYSSARWWNSCW